MSRFARVCCPLDFSEPSNRALEVAADLASHVGATLTLVHVRDLVAEPLPGTPQAAAEEVGRGEAQARLAEARASIEARFSCPVETVLLTGDPAWEVAKRLSSGAHDLAVLGTHGRTGLTRLLVGSVAERVLRYATCPVLVVPPADRGREATRDTAPGTGAGER